MECDTHGLYKTGVWNMIHMGVEYDTHGLYKTGGGVEYDTHEIYKTGGSNNICLHEVELSGNNRCQQIEINSYPDGPLFISTGFLPRVISKKLN